MTANHAELCERLRDGPARVGVMRYAADLIESQAARIQQQALEYVSLFDQCSEHLARIAKLEFLLDSERSTNKALSDENALLADRQPHELLVKIAELEKERDALKVDAERWRIIESTLPTDELQDIAIIVAAEHSVNVANGFSRTPTDLLDTAITTLQAEKETR